MCVIIDVLTKFLSVERASSSSEEATEESLLRRLRHISCQKHLTHHLCQLLTVHPKHIRTFLVDSFSINNSYFVGDEKIF